jgi:integrase
MRFTIVHATEDSRTSRLPCTLPDMKKGAPICSLLCLLAAPVLASAPDLGVFVNNELSALVDTYKRIHAHPELSHPGQGMVRRDVLAMVKRRCAAVGLPCSICNHSFRTTGITVHAENGGRIEDAAAFGGHASARTTQLNNRKSRKIQRAEVERVQI